MKLVVLLLLCLFLCIILIFILSLCLLQIYIQEVRNLYFFYSWKQGFRKQKIISTTKFF